MTHSPDHAEGAARINQLRQRLAEASAQPWVYRPSKYDDWGWIRGVERDDRDIGPFRPIVANAKDSMVGEAAMNAHRSAGTDPYGPNALLIVEAVNSLPWLLDLAEVALRGRDALVEAQARECQSVWRCAVGDITGALDALKNRCATSRRKHEREAGAALAGVLVLVWAARDPAPGNYSEAAANGKVLAERVRSILSSTVREGERENG